MKATKCIVIGDEPTTQDKRPIVFTAFLDALGELDNGPCTKPCALDRVELICRNYSDSLGDCMFGYNGDKREDGTIYFGKWNDGVAL